jgi:hypothetical protein
VNAKTAGLAVSTQVESLLSTDDPGAPERLSSPAFLSAVAGKPAARAGEDCDCWNERDEDERNEDASGLLVRGFFL